MGEKRRGSIQYIDDAKFTGILLILLDEADLAEHAIILVGPLAKHLHFSACGEDLRSDQLHDRRFARAISAEQPVYFSGFQGEADLIECDNLSVAFRQPLNIDNSVHLTFSPL